MPIRWAHDVFPISSAELDLLVNHPIERLRDELARMMPWQVWYWVFMVGATDLSILQTALANRYLDFEQVVFRDFERTMRLISVAEYLHALD